MQRFDAGHGPIDGGFQGGNLFALSLCACAAADKKHRALLEAIQQQIFWFSAELASTRGCVLLTRWPVKSEVVPASPVRV
jgi:hypothetical protein